MKKIISILLCAALSVSCMTAIIAAEGEDNTASQPPTADSTSAESETSAGGTTGKEPPLVKHSVTFVKNFFEKAVDGIYENPEQISEYKGEKIDIFEPVYDDLIYTEPATGYKYEMIFKYWTNALDSTGRDAADGALIIKDGDVLTIDYTLSLYAVWEYKIIDGMIDLNTNVLHDAYTTVPSTDEYVFSLTPSTEIEVAHYTVYDRNGKELYKAEADFPADKIVLKNGQSALIITDPSIYTIVHENDGMTDYEIAAMKTVNLGSDIEKIVHMNPRYILPVGSITIKKLHDNNDDSVVCRIEGVDAADKENSNHNIDITVIIPSDKSDITVNNLPCGEYVVTYDNNWSIRYATTTGSEFHPIISWGGQVKLVEFQLRLSPLKYWLIANSYTEYRGISANH